MLSGLPGCGKSHLARELAAQTPAVVVSSDRVRRLLFSRPTYSEGEHSFVHDVCYRLAARGLATGRIVILDATNLRESIRQRYRTLAWRYEAPMHLVVVESAEATVRQRLQRRASGQAQDGSDADDRVYDHMRQTVEPIRQPHLRVRGDGDVRAAAQQVLALLQPEARQVGQWTGLQTPTVAAISAS